MIADLNTVTYRYPESSGFALRDVEVAIEEGAIVLIVGRSGSGKSTFLRTLNGLVPHFTGGEFGGHVRVSGLDARTTAPRDLSAAAGMVFQDPEAQLFTTRVDAEIAFSMEQHGVGRPEMRRRVEELLDLMGIAHLRHRHPAHLSGGERQRVAIASALALGPPLLILDEPTSQLDPWGAEDVFASLVRINHDLGITLVMAEHRLERSLYRATKVLELTTGGRLGAPMESREAAVRLDLVAVPPVVQLARRANWTSVPLTVREARSTVLQEEFTPAGSKVSSKVNQEGEERVQVSGLSIDFDGASILEGVSFAVRAGEFVALMGRNGSGKTTLLRTLIGFQEASRGVVRILEQDRSSHDRPTQLSGVGFVPQQPGTVLFRETIARELGHDADSELVERFGLGPLLQRNPNDLSGGERERTALALAMTRGTRLLLLDEPTRGMDAWRKAELASQLRQRASAGVAIMLATHDVELVAMCATRVMILGDRGLIADGAPSEVLAGSFNFAPQMNRLFGGDYLTVNDVLDGSDH